MGIQLLTFTLWSNIVLPNMFLSDGELSGVDKVCRIIMTIIAIYLVCIELLAWCGHFRKYIKAPSRIFNTATPAIILINVWSESEDAL